MLGSGIRSSLEIYKNVGKQIYTVIEQHGVVVIVGHVGNVSDIILGDIVGNYRVTRFYDVFHEGRNVNIAG